MFFQQLWFTIYLTPNLPFILSNIGFISSDQKATYNIVGIIKIFVFELHTTLVL